MHIVFFLKLALYLFKLAHETQQPLDDDQNADITQAYNFGWEKNPLMQLHLHDLSSLVP